MFGPCTGKFLKVEQQLVKHVQYVNFDLGVRIITYYNSSYTEQETKCTCRDAKCTVLHDYKTFLNVSDGGNGMCCRDL